MTADKARELLVALGADMLVGDGERDESGFVPKGSRDDHLLQAGVLDKEEYRERLVLRATAHLEEVLDDERLADIRAALRRELELEPSLAGLVDVVASGG